MQLTSQNQQRLATLISSLEFGRILDLHIRQGEPVFVPAPTVLRNVKIAGVRSPNRSRGVDQPQEIKDLLTQIRRLGDGVIHRIEIANGLPLFIEVAEPVSAMA